MKIRFLLIALGIVVTFTTLKAQEEQNSETYSERPSFLDKIYVGGGFGAGFGDYTYVNISPIIGYMITPKLSTGVRLMYQYTTFDYYYSNGRKENYSGNDYGASIFGRQMLFGPIFLQAEYEYLNYSALYSDGSKGRADFNSFLAGGGISQPIGRKAFLFLTVLYNFSYESYNNYNSVRSPYNSPWVVRVGVTAGF